MGAGKMSGFIRSIKRVDSDMKYLRTTSLGARGIKVAILDFCAYLFDICLVFPKLLQVLQIPKPSLGK